MGFIKGTCPKCKGELQIPEELDKIICMYCGVEIKKSEALNQNNEILKDPSYLNDIEEVKESLSKIINFSKDPLKSFSKKEYKSAFKTFYTKHDSIFIKIEQLYQKSPVQEELVKEIAEAFLESVNNTFSTYKNKRKKEDTLLNYNMIMAVYVFPSILELEGESSMPLAQALLDEWKDNFPKTNLAISTFKNINDGFNKKFCYITTAVCESLGKTDDCYELTLLRNYRDNYLQHQLDGEALIKKYYDIAPTIVKRIDRQKDSRVIYHSVWKNYLNPCIQCIEEDANEKCMKIYRDMVETLEEKYFT